MMVTLTRRYEFQAAHYLPKVAPGHKCGRLHGHSFSVEIAVSCPVQDSGMGVDFADIDAVVLPLVARLEHQTLNDIEGLENPTSELLALWFISRVPMASSVTVMETAKSSCTLVR